MLCAPFGYDAFAYGVLSCQLEVGRRPETGMEGIYNIGWVNAVIQVRRKTYQF